MDEVAHPSIATAPLRQLAMPRTLAEAWSRWDGFAELLPGETTRRAPNLVPTHEMPHLEWFLHLHKQVADIESVGCGFVADAIVTGQGYVFKDGALLTQPVYLHNVAQQELQAQPHLLPGNLQTAPRLVVDRPVLEILGPGSPVFGHWLVDFLPRAAIARQLLGPAFDRFVIPLPADLPDWTLDLLRTLVGFQPENALRYDQGAEHLLCRRLCSPTFGHSAENYFFHSVVRDFYAGFAPPRAGRGTRRLCVSRRNFEQSTRGVLKGFRQRAYLEQQAIDRGFEIICPEEMTLRQQIERFSDAGIVIGEYGSALHNTLFSGPRVVVGSIRYPNSIQTRIAALCGQHVLYLIPDIDGKDERGAEIYEVAENKIDRFLDQLIALDGAMAAPTDPA
ncbi:glycosyltransferase family 61 protein [Rhizosaccharibacter radicis]|uniref:Glycosyltransferase family 61 protein n=1 Tax=Rhizosaccharibacter radicis TaxID=2782605 RepID=A0ABT1W073_9PROT|nr:glycosyltransferase family 61 protein [Acetobacteraceae bacterium KSS12]